MLFKARSAAVYGIDAHLIDVEVDFSQIKLDKEQFSTVGLPDAAVRESRDRVRSAIKNSGFEIPCSRPLEMSWFRPLEVSGSKDGLDIDERARSETDRSVE